MRLRTLPLSLSGVVLGTMLAAADFHINPWGVVFLFLTTVSLQILSNLSNELGDTLSGGERQRLGLARAFLSGAPFLLLDEPTSNLDSLNEGVILQSLAEQRGTRTVLLVSHRESTMGIADQTYAMNDGRVS